MGMRQKNKNTEMLSTFNMFIPPTGAGEDEFKDLGRDIWVRLLQGEQALYNGSKPVN